MWTGGPWARPLVLWGGRGALLPAGPVAPGWSATGAGLAVRSGGQRQGAALAGQAPAGQVAQVQRGGAARSRSSLSCRTSLRPVLQVVQRARSGQSRHSAPKVATRVRLKATVCPAGQVTVPRCSSTVKSSAVKPALDGRARRLGLDHRLMAGLLDRIPLLIGDDPGLRIGGDMGPVPIAARFRRFAGMPGVWVQSGDHAVFGDLAGDPPPPIPAIRPFGGLDVLPGDQRQQRQRAGGPESGVLMNAGMWWTIRVRRDRRQALRVSPSALGARQGRTPHAWGCRNG